MSDTPETDAVREHWMVKINFPYDPVPAEFARRMERERDEARDWKNVKVSKGGETHCLGTLIEMLERERDEARELARELRDAFERFYGFPNCSRARGLAQDALTKAKEVLP